MNCEVLLTVMQYFKTCVCWGGGGEGRGCLLVEIHVLLYYVHVVLDITCIKGKSVPFDRT